MPWDSEILCEICKMDRLSNFNNILLKSAEYHTGSLNQNWSVFNSACSVFHRAQTQRHLSYWDFMACKTGAAVSCYFSPDKMPDGKGMDSQVSGIGLLENR